MELYRINEKLANRPQVQARMDEQDRLKYIRECKDRLGLNDTVLMKSSKRTILDQ